MRTPREAAAVLAVGALIAVLPPGHRVEASEAKAPLTFYVSGTHGDDEWSGRRAEPNAAQTDGPFATIRRAQRAVRQHKEEHGGLSRPVEVRIRGGRYTLRRPLIFRPADSGTAKHRVTYSNYAEERPVLSGGRRLGPWRETDDGLWRMRLKGVADDEWRFRQLWVDGERRPRARMPNEGFYRFERMVRPDEPRAKINRKAFVYRDGQIRGDWTNLQDVEILKYFGWNETRRTIARVAPDERTVHLAGPVAEWDKRPLRWFGKRYTVENVREGLDQPGEWYLNEETGVLTYHPAPGKKPGGVTTVAPVADHLLRFAGEPGGPRVRHITVEGLTFAHSRTLVGETGYAEKQSDIFAPGAIEGQATHNIHLRNNEIVHVGGYGIDFNGDCRGLRIVGNRLRELGGGGMQIGPTRDPQRASRQTRGNRITDNEVHDGGHIYIAGAGIWIGHSARNTIAHNEVHHLHGMGISLGWTWADELTGCHHNRVRYNHIHDLGGGYIGAASGIYFLARQPGTVAHHNLIHHLRRFTAGRDRPGFGPSHPAFGFQLDQGASQLRLHHNVVHHVPDAAYKQMGTAQTVRNNIFAYAAFGPELLRRADQGAVFFQQNIVLSRDPKLFGDHWDKQNSRIDYNLHWVAGGEAPRFDGKPIERWRKMGRGRHSRIAEPVFGEIKRGDRVFKPGEAARDVGFSTIDLRRVGPRPPEQRR